MHCKDSLRPVGWPVAMEIDEIHRLGAGEDVCQGNHNQHQATHHKAGLQLQLRSVVLSKGTLCKAALAVQ